MRLTMRLSEAIVMVSRSAAATVVATPTNANDGLVWPQLIEQLTG